mmetsp:Transcript_23592/g.55142  ORF Transcript_23592/g.55142 Transcript_23592/m.55142 type:complete len:236 (+) Transcript_23592:1284-1991(+)
MSSRTSGSSLHGAAVRVSCNASSRKALWRMRSAESRQRRKRPGPLAVTPATRARFSNCATAALPRLSALSSSERLAPSSSWVTADTSAQSSMVASKASCNRAPACRHSLLEGNELSLSSLLRSSNSARGTLIAPAGSSSASLQFEITRARNGWTAADMFLAIRSSSPARCRLLMAFSSRALAARPLNNTGSNRPMASSSPATTFALRSSCSLRCSRALISLFLASTSGRALSLRS